ncbi:MAG: hypothetical protein K1000chlam1_00401 [Candidatus Anoxychlamydiales bacterium]|nr:hypothetical protein [Candidatus Anoxychlamydiales bacterium]
MATNSRYSSPANRLTYTSTIASNFLKLATEDKETFLDIFQRIENGSDISAVAAFCIDEMKKNKAKNSKKVLKALEIIGASNGFEQFHKNHTPMTYAAKKGHNLVVEALLRERLNVNLKDKKEQKSPLIHATIGGHENIVKMLLNNKSVNVNDTDYYLLTALFYARHFKNDSITRLLLDKEAEYFLTEADKCLALERTLKANKLELASEILPLLPDLVECNIIASDVSQCKDAIFEAISHLMKSNIIGKEKTSIFLLQKYGSFFSTTEIQTLDQMARDNQCFDVLSFIRKKWENVFFSFIIFDEIDE